MTSFYVEFRLSGYAKTHARSLIWDVSRKFRVNGMTRRRPVPHVTLYPTSSARNMRDVVHAVEKVGRRYTLVPFSIRRFDRFTDKRVIYLDIEASQTMKQLRAELAWELNSLTSGRPESTDLDYPFHATIAFKDLGSKFEPIWDYISTRQRPDIDQHLLRIAVLGKGSKIVCEYDLVLKRTLSRRQALSGYWWSKTLDELRRLQGRPSQGPSVHQVRRLRRGPVMRPLQRRSSEGQSWDKTKRVGRRPARKPSSLIHRILRFVSDLVRL
jgi:2'-5' RNA ligase